MVKIRVHRVTTHTIKHMKTCHLNFIDFMNSLQSLSTHYITQLIVLMKINFLPTTLTTNIKIPTTQLQLSSCRDF